MNYGFVIDNGSCIGCHACSTACKSENEVPLGVYRTWVKTVEVGRFPDVRRSFQVTRCNHCANPPCVRICPTAAMHQRADGIVDFDSDACIGCKGCIQACPYDAIHMDPESHTAAKCNFCAHRTDVGLEPACVIVCPEHAIVAGDLDDPTSEISRVLARHPVTVRKPEQGTAPKLFYVEGHDPALHPTAPLRAASFAAAEVRDDHPVSVGGPGGERVVRRDARGTPVRVPEPQGMPSGGPIQVRGNMAAQMVQVAYDAQHATRWHWPIPAYLVTKHVAGGTFGLLGLVALLPGFVFPGEVMAWAGLLGILATLVTLALLVYDLDRPDRFFYLLVRPQWKSWIARAAWILTAFAVVTTCWWLVEAAAFAGFVPQGLGRALRPLFALLAIPLSALAATYTAFLFAQAEGRDLWQSAHLLPQMGAHALVLGGGTLLTTAALVGAPDGTQVVALVALLGGAVASLLVTLAGDFAIPHATEFAQRAAREMTRGRFRRPYRAGLALAHLPVLLLPVLPEIAFPGALFVAIPLAALGIFLYAWALVMAPQAVPNS